MVMDENHLPLTKEYSEQEPTMRSLDAPSSELAEAYNMLVRMSTVADENDYAPYLGDFKVFPLPVPPKPWDFDTSLPKMDTLKGHKPRVPIPSSRGGVKPKEKKE